MTQTILVLGTNAGQADLIRHMKARGWHVVGCSPRKDEVGQQYCDAVEHVNIVDIDALEVVARKHNIDLVYSISSDVAIRSVVALSERLGLPRFFESNFIDMLDDKSALRAFLEREELGPVPFTTVSDAADAELWSTYPCMVKPVDAQGQRGITKVDTADGLSTAIATATASSKSGKAIIEGFLDGVEVSVNVLSCGGETKIKVLSERLIYGPQAPGVPTGHLVPTKNLTHAEQDACIRLADGIVKAMAVNSGVLYFQMIVTDQGPFVVEIAPRLDGCHMWRLIQSSFGFDLIEKTIDCLLGKSVPTIDTPVTGGEIPMELMFQQLPTGQVCDYKLLPIPLDAGYHEYRCNDGAVPEPINGTMETVGYYVRPVK